MTVMNVQFFHSYSAAYLNNLQISFCSLSLYSTFNKIFYIMTTGQYGIYLTDGNC
jgi:hypothetical protein